MEHSPLATAALLITLAVLAAALALLYERDAWCRYCCPLGAMGGVFSMCAPLRVRARRGVCTAGCVGNECYRGSATAEGCPMYNHALFLNDARHCKLCMRCLQSCPTRAPRVVLQSPLHDLRQHDSRAADLAPVVVAVAGAALLLPWFGHVPPAPGEHRLVLATAGYGGDLALAAVVALGLPWFSTRSSGEWLGAAVSLLYGFAPVAAGALLAYHLAAVPWLGAASLSLHHGSRTWEASPLGGGQLLVLTVGAAFSVWALLSVSGTVPGRGRLRRLLPIGLAAGVVSYAAVAAWLLR